MKKSNRRSGILSGALENQMTSAANEESARLDALWIKEFGKSRPRPATFLDRNEQLYARFGRDVFSYNQ